MNEEDDYCYGVSVHRKSGRWQAWGMANVTDADGNIRRRQKHIGLYETKEEAIRARKTFEENNPVIAVPYTIAYKPPRFRAPVKKRTIRKRAYF